MRRMGRGGRMRKLGINWKIRGGGKGLGVDGMGRLKGVGGRGDGEESTGGKDKRGDWEGKRGEAGRWEVRLRRRVGENMNDTQMLIFSCCFRRERLRFFIVLFGC
jgi:hypothetical protein